MEITLTREKIDKLIDAIHGSCSTPHFDLGPGNLRKLLTGETANLSAEQMLVLDKWLSKRIHYHNQKPFWAHDPW